MKNPLPISIRSADPLDAASIAAIYNTYVDLGGSTFDIHHWSGESVATWLPLPLPAGWFVATQGDAPASPSVGDRIDRDPIIGWASVRPISERHGLRHTCESAIYLNPVCLGGGVADALQEHLAAHCRRHAIHHVTARIISANQRSIRFHLRHGYEIVGVQKEVGRVDNRWVDLTVLQLLIDCGPR